MHTNVATRVLNVLGQLAPDWGIKKNECRNTTLLVKNLYRLGQK